MLIFSYHLLILILNYLGKVFSDNVVQFLLQRFESKEERIRIGTLNIIKHIVNSARKGNNIKQTQNKNKKQQINYEKQKTKNKLWKTKINKKSKKEKQNNNNNNNNTYTHTHTEKEQIESKATL